MADQITINKDSLVEIRKNLTLFKEESEELLKTCERRIINAEIEGWNDITYEEFSDRFSEINLNIKNEFKNIDEEIIPFLRKLEVSFDEFFA